MFLLGIIIGSFLNVCIYRIPHSISVVKRRSHCPKCKCRYCHTEIPSRYFKVELLTGILYILIYQVYGYTLQSLIHFIFVAILIVIAYIDYDTMDIYDYNHYLIIGLGIFRYLFIKDISLLDQIVGALSLFLPLLLLYYLLKDGIGGGDVKLVGSCGFYLGISHNVIAFFISTMSAVLYASYLVIIKKESSKTRIPFGPFLCSGFIIALLQGSRLLDLYITIL